MPMSAITLRSISLHRMLFAIWTAPRRLRMNMQAAVQAVEARSRLGFMRATVPFVCRPAQGAADVAKGEDSAEVQVQR